MDSHKKRNLVKDSDWSNRVDNWVVAEKRDYGVQSIEVSRQSLELMSSLIEDYESNNLTCVG